MTHHFQIHKNLRPFLIAATLLFLSACGGEDTLVELPTIPAVTPLPSPTRQPSPTPWPTATSLPTTSPTVGPTGTPDATATWVAENIITLDAEFESQGVSLRYSPVLFPEIIPVLEQPRADGLRTLDESLPVLDGVPDHIVFRGPFDEASTSRPPMLVVQSIVDETGFFYSSYEISEQEYFNELRRIAITRPGFNLFFKPEDFVLEADYLDFQNGKGIASIRYLPSADGPEEITNRQLFYTFEGITDSGNFFVWFQYPVKVTALPDSESFTENQLTVLASNEDNFAIYRINEREQVRLSLENGELKPGREVLDELMQTLFVAQTAGGRIATVAEPTITNTPLPQNPEDPNADPTQNPDLGITPEPDTTPVGGATPEPVATPTAEAVLEPTVEPTSEPAVTSTSTSAPQEATAVPEPEATAQSSAGVPTYAASCSNFLLYLEDVTIPDYTEIGGGDELEKTWRVRNDGSCPITSNFKIEVSGLEDVVLVGTMPLETIEPGDSGLVTITLQAPNTAGTYEVNAQLVAPDGEKFGSLFAIFIVP